MHPVVLDAPPPVKQQKISQSKTAATARSRANPWWCTCLPVWPAGAGRPWHALGCPRKQFDTTGILPTVGTRVTVMGSAGARGGQVWECVRVKKDGCMDGWQQVS